MNQQLMNPEAPEPMRPPSIAAPVLVWTAIQLIPLMLSAARVPLWARTNHPIEDHAPFLMLAAQAGGAALLFPWLMQRPRSAAIVMLLALPFMQLAGVLSDTPVTQILMNALAVSLWLASLAFWSTALRTRQAQAIGISVAAAVAFGAACLSYLRAEFTSADTAIPSTAIWISLWVIFAVSALASAVMYRAQMTSYPQPGDVFSTGNCGKTNTIG
jgi:hypothetical protein